MKSRAVLSLAVALGAAGLLSAAGPPPKPAADHLDYVFFASDRPYYLRLHVQVHGRPYYAAWDDYMKELFAWLDRNRDGALGKEEVEGRMPSPNFLMSHLQGSIGNQLRGQTAALAMVDTNKDGKISLEEFKAYYRRTGFAPLRFSAGAGAAVNTKRITDAFYKRLDADGDGKLSEAELAKAGAKLRKLDTDEDEMFTAQEVAPDERSREAYGPVGFYGDSPRAAPRGPGFVNVNNGGTVDGAVKQMIDHYDKGKKDGKLDAKESGLDKALFDKLDGDKDGRLDAKELAGFFARDPDLELVSRLGKLGGVGGLLDRVGVRRLEQKRLEAFNPKGRAMPLAGRLSTVDAATLGLTLGDAKFQLQGSQPNRGQPRFYYSRRFYLEQFDNLDLDKKGYVDKSQEKDSQGYPYLFQIMPLADRDGDGKLTRKELTAYLDLQTGGGECTVTVSVNDQGRSLFEVIDANNDGRLGARELRTAWQRAKPLARHKAGLVPDDIPRRLQVSVGMGYGGFRGVPVGGPPLMRVGGPTKSAPAWFTKMDRNGDGDVSAKEFLGTEDEFKMLDADGDGLIDADEARRYEDRRAKQERGENEKR